MDISKLPYRQGIDARVLDADNNILIVQKNSYDSSQWGFPGGGIEEGDNSIEEALRRELEEEVGITDYQLVGISSHTLEYDLPEYLIQERIEKKLKLFRGQQKRTAVVRVSEQKPQILLQEEELRDYKWVRPQDIEQYLVFAGQFEYHQKVTEEFDLR